ncbi:hypothetical protein Taro_052218 [Colocasia esculenta]|uniref:Uncharacterized protein n=1 Tax=Colocasia esculenta TaxID=4460 RepID=A0A843XHV7_COLES|nr:hypothetical protein [Colocasia esculenta]
MAVGVAFWLPLLGSTSACAPRIAHGVEFADVRNGKATPYSTRPGKKLLRLCWAIWRFGGVLIALLMRGSREEWGKCPAMYGLRILHEGGGTVVFVFQWWYLVVVGDVLVVLGARRRWPFRCEGPNGSALLLEGVRIMLMSFTWCSAPEGLSREKGCYHLPGTPILVRLRGSVQGDEHTRVMDSGVEGKMVVRIAVSSRLQSSLGWSGTLRTLRLLSSGKAHVGRSRRGGSRHPRSFQWRRTGVAEDRTALLETFLHLCPSVFYGDYDPDRVESWTHELERTFETMECAEKDQMTTRGGGQGKQQKCQSRFAEQSVQQGAEQGSVALWERVFLCTTLG